MSAQRPDNGGDGPQDTRPDDGIDVGDKDDDGEAAVTSPGAWTPAAAPGKPDGEVDTRG